MVFMTVLVFVLAAATVFVTIQVMTPFLYEIWFNNLQSQNPGKFQEIGNNAFGAWLVMSYIVPGLIIMWGIISANRKRVQEQRFE